MKLYCCSLYCCKLCIVMFLAAGTIMQKDDIKKKKKVRERRFSDVY